MRLSTFTIVMLLTASTECLQTKIKPAKGSSVSVSTVLPSDECSVCKVSGVNGTETSCTSSLVAEPEVEIQLLFKCSQAVDKAFAATISQSIVCTKDACSPATVESQSAILAELPRTFTWTITAPEKTLVGLDILGEGLKESTEPCQNGYQYTITMPKSNEKVHYCKAGSVTHLDLLSGAVVSLQVKPKATVEPVLFQASAGPLKGPTVVVTVTDNEKMVVSRNPKEPECDLCSLEGGVSTCSSTGKTLTGVSGLSLEFGCLKPQDVYQVEISKKIECVKTSCTPGAVELDPELFKGFQRSLTWVISVPDKTVLTLDVLGGGLKEVPASEECQDGVKYSTETRRSDGELKMLNYCSGGTLSRLDLPGTTTLSVRLPQGAEVNKKLFSVSSAPRASRMMSVIPDQNTIVRITRVSVEPDCSVCVDLPPNQKCHPNSLTLRDSRNTSVEFTCPQPQDVYKVEINREIDCTATSCSGDIVQPESSLFPDFDRTFTWDLKVISTRTFQLDFPPPGMGQIPNKDTCPDGHTYSLITYLRTGPATIGTFCKGGTVTTIQARYKGRVSLDVPGDRSLDAVDFKLKVGPETSKLAIVKVNLPRGVSTTDFISANYPNDFPDAQQMQWDFVVPGMHNYSVKFHNHSEPECLSGEFGVEYQKQDKKVSKVALTDPQPEHQQGNFNMMLKNCETNRTLEGLSLKYSVSGMRSGHPVLCTVDLTKLQKVSLQIDKVGSDPYCEMSLDSKVVTRVEVAAGSKASLSFLDCPKEDLRLTAAQVIECKSISSCPSTFLTVPTLDACLPMPLHSFKWDIIIPEDGTIDLVSPSDGLEQALPGERCNGSTSLHLAEADGLSVGDFCLRGRIQKVQMHANVSVTAIEKDFNKNKGPFLNVSFSPGIPETIIYSISPEVGTQTLLATPNWPAGMRPLSTVAWIVNLPSQYQAHMQVVNFSQPKCSDRHTSIKVRMLGYEEEMMSRREDESIGDKLLIPNSFYLNMSNCIPEKEYFGAVTKIILEPKTNILALVLGIVGALLALLLIVLAAVCLVKMKKKRDRMNKESSIYIGKGNIFIPGDHHFTKSRSDNESHVYASIDESRIYSHLLGDSSYSDSIQDRFNGMQVDAYNTFTGPVDGPLPVIKEPEPEPEMDQYSSFLDPSETFIPSRPRTPIDRQDSLGFEDRRMVDNELYTFRSTGDINTIRLSATNLEREPSILEETF
ncbi:CUB domain-containing protein 1 [Synchiropus picturatus]